MLLFAEGTDFSEWGIERSNSFAEKNGLPKYEYVLHPRTTGFTFLCETMEKCELETDSDCFFIFQ